MKTRELLLIAALSMTTLRFGAAADSVTFNGMTVTMDQVARFAPIVGLHNWEEYLPCSIDYILSHSTVRLGNPSLDADKLSDGVDILQHPTQQQLYNIALSDPTGEDHYLSIESSIRKGGPVARSGPPYVTTDLVDIPMYVSVQIPADKSYVDLNFIFLFAYNGPQTIRGLEPGRHFNAALPNWAEHEGDIESMSVRVSADFQRVIFVRFEAHGDSSFYAPSEVDFEGTHPKVSCALFSHAAYNGKGLNDNDWIVLQDVGMAEIVDIVNDGAQWRPFEHNKLIFVGLDTNNVPINDQLWARFAGRLGVHQLNRFQGVEGIGGGLDFDQEGYAELVGAIGQSRFDALFLGTNLKTHDAAEVGVGPGGLGNRGFMQGASPVWAIPEVTGVLFAGVANNMVLSVNPTDRTGPLIIDSFQPGAPAQQWRRQTWAGLHGNPRFVWINQLSGLMMKATGNNGELVTQTSVLDSYVFWNLGGDEGNDFHAVQFSPDIGQNLNILGGGPYNPGRAVGTYGWGGGDANEIWKFFSDNPKTITGSIQSRIAGGIFYLSVNPANPAGQLIIDTLHDGAPAQTWIREEFPGDSGNPSYIFRSQLTGLMITANGNNGSPLTQTATISPNDFWFFGGDEGSGYHAIQFGPDIGQNINVLGAGPYAAGRAVGTYGWGGGDDNETWRFNSPDIVPVEKEVVIQTGLLRNNANMVLSVSPANVDGQVVIDDFHPGSNLEIWIRKEFPRVGGTAYVFVNKLTGKALYAPGGNGPPVTQVNFDKLNDNIYWKLGSDEGNDFHAVQHAIDIGQNLNVFGDYSNYPGAAVGTYGWGGGDANEIWRFVFDTSAPAMNVPADITVNAAPGRTSAAVTYLLSATDNFGSAALRADPPSGSEFQIGTNYVYCEAIDPSGNTTGRRSFKVIVRDVENPTIFCPKNVVANAAAGATARVNFPALAYDNSGKVTVTCTPDTGSDFPIGTTTVTCVATDSSGNSISKTFPVMVLDESRAPLLQVGAPGGTGVEFFLQGEAGWKYQIQYNESLEGNSWQVLTNITLTGTTLQFTAPSDSAAKSRFYRGVLVSY